MSKNIFKAIDIKDLGRPVWVESELMESIREEKKKEDYNLKLKQQKETLEEIHSFEEEFQNKKKTLIEELAEKEKSFEEKMLENKKEAEKWSLEKIKKANKEAEEKIEEANKIYEKKIQEAEEKIAKLMDNASQELEKTKKEAYQKGYEEGFNISFEKGRLEKERLISRLGMIITTAIQKRNTLVEELESQIVDIIILIARKVIKSISQDQKRVVYDNVKEALRMLKGRTEIIIRINSEDLPIVTKHKKEFIEMIEGIESLKILEDNSVDRGGCYITTEFGEIDAKISTQLSDIEDRIKKISPIKEEF